MPAANILCVLGGDFGVHVARKDADGVGDALVVNLFAVEAGEVVEVAD